MPQLDTFISQRPLADQGIQPVNPAVGSLGLGPAFDHLSQSAQAAYVAVQRDNQRQQKFQEELGAKELVIKAQQHAQQLQQSIDQEITAPTPDDQGRPRPAITPNDAVNKYTEGINQAYTDFSKEAKKLGPHADAYFATAFRSTVAGEGYHQYVRGKLKAQQDFQVFTREKQVEDFKANALSAPTLNDAETHLKAVFSSFSMNVLDGVTPGAATTAMNKVRDDVYIGRAKASVMRDPHGFFDYVRGKSSALPGELGDKRYQQYLTRPDVQNALLETAKSVMAEERTQDSERVQQDDRDHKQLSEGSYNKFLGDMTNPDPTKRWSPTKGLTFITDPENQRVFGSHYRAAVDFARIMAKEDNDVKTDRPTYNALLSRVLVGDLTDPTDIVNSSSKLSISDMSHLIQETRTAASQEDRVQQQDLQRGLQYMDGRLATFTQFGAAENRQAVAAIKGQALDWYMEQRKRGTLPKQDIFKKLTEMTEQAYARVVPATKHAIQLEMNTQPYKNAQDLWKAAGEGKVSIQEANKRLKALATLEDRANAAGFTLDKQGKLQSKDAPVSKTPLSDVPPSASGQRQPFSFGPTLDLSGDNLEE